MQHKARGRFESSDLVELEMLRHVTDDLARMLQGPGETQHNVQLELIPDGLRINVFDHSHKPVFEPDSDVFTPYGAWVFSTLAWEISRYHSFKIELEGHTESGPPGGREALNKWELSTERANAARRELVQSGVSPDQIYKVSGFADTKPMPNVSPAADVNRRVTVVLRLQEPGFSSEPVQASNGKPS